MTTAMTKAERDELLRLVKARARVAKAEVDQRKAELLADFESGARLPTAVGYGI